MRGTLSASGFRDCAATSFTVPAAINGTAAPAAIRLVNSRRFNCSLSMMSGSSEFDLHQIRGKVRRGENRALGRRL